MSKIITFTNMSGADEQYFPKPSENILPEWYKKTESYIGKKKKPSGDGNTTGTVKRCMPVFDALTAGYIITSPADVYVSQRDGQPWFEWISMGLISFHPVEQAELHPGKNGYPYPKWNNPWGIKTAPGYSCLFVQPFHRESKFTILPGMVDTDTYTSPVNFPFVMNDPQWEGLIPAGTPIAQVIPFKRDSFKMELGDQTDIQESQRITNKLRTRFFDSYKNQFWHKKSYK
jgi:hypothetical protein